MDLDLLPSGYIDWSGTRGDRKCAEQIEAELQCVSERCFFSVREKIVHLCYFICDTKKRRTKKRPQLFKAIGVLRIGKNFNVYVHSENITLPPYSALLFAFLLLLSVNSPFRTEPRSNRQQLMIRKRQITVRGFRSVQRHTSSQTRRTAHKFSGWQRKPAETT